MVTKLGPSDSICRRRDWDNGIADRRFSAEPQIAQTADDVVLRNVKISPDGEVTGKS
jgi:hypothetical protein